MSHNGETKLTPVVSTATIGSGGSVLVSSMITETKVYDLLFGVTVGAAVTVGDATNQVVPITATAPFSVASKSINRQHIPLDPSDWTVSGAEDDTIWVMYLVEMPQGL